MTAQLHRYWFTFDGEPLPPGMGYGCGVTAWTVDDARNLITAAVGEVPPVAEVVEDIDVQSLDQGHVVPNMLPPNERGIWFPMGFATGT